MAHELSQSRSTLRGFGHRGPHRVKDSILLVIVFLIGLVGTCYILHFALSQKPTSTYIDSAHPDAGDASESIYQTVSSR